MSDKVRIPIMQNDTLEVTRVVATTELAKLQAVSEESQAIGAFLDWLREREDPITLCVWRNSTRLESEGHYPASIPYEKLLAEYFDIDLQKIDDERRALLDALRESHGS